MARGGAMTGPRSHSYIASEHRLTPGMFTCKGMNNEWNKPGRDTEVL